MQNIKCFQTPTSDRIHIFYYLIRINQEKNIRKMKQIFLNIF